MSDVVYNQDHFSVDFLIITALPEERDAILRQLGDYSKFQADGSPTYYKSSVSAYPRDDSYEVAVTMLNQMGNVEAAHHTSQAIRDLDPACVLMVGISGGIKGEVELGDVIVANQVLYYEQVKQKPKRTDPRPQSYPVDPILLDRAQNYTDAIWRDLIKAQRPDGTSNKDIPRVHFAPVAVGEAVIADQRIVNQLKKIHSKIAGVEMESFGVALAVANAATRPRFLAIRGVSDYADPGKNDDWHEYAADSAAAFTIGFLRTGPVSSKHTITSENRARKVLVAIRHQSMEPLLAQAISRSLPTKLKKLKMEELVIDQTDLYIDGRLIDPVKAAQRQIDLTQRLASLLKIYPDAELAYFGIAHIPLLFLAGYQLSTKQRIHLFEHNRRTDEWNLLQIGGNYPKIKLEGMPTYLDQTKGDLIIRISVSYPVTLEAITGIVPTPIASLHLAIDHPGLDIVTSKKQLREYSMIFRAMLDEIHNKLPNTECIHIFYAGPVTVAFNFGRMISKTIHPKIIIYNYFSRDTPSYAWGLAITSSVESANFLVKTKGLEGDL